MPVLSTVAAACARAWGFTAGDLFAGAALALDFNETTTLDSRITFTRATSATYFDSSGVLQTASSGAARFDHRLESGSWVNKGLLIEEQRTNICLQSEDFGTTWSVTNATITTNAVAAPDGNTTADQITDNATNGGHFARQTFTGTAPTQTFTGSVYLKNDDCGWARIIVSGEGVDAGNQNRAWFNLATGEVGTVENLGTGTGATASIEDVGDGWYRCVVSGKPSTTGSNTLLLITTQTADQQLTYIGTGQSLYAWGAQLEVGAFPTSYIKTTTASVTRNADQASMTGTDFSSWYNATEGTLFNQFACLGDISSSGWVAARIVSISDDTLNERIQLTVNNTPSISGLVSDGNVIQVNLTNTPSSTTANTTYKYSFAYKANDFADSLDGATVNTDTSGSLPSPNRMYIGAAPVSGSTNFLNGHLAKFYYWNTRKSNTFLQSITG